MLHFYFSILGSVAAVSLWKGEPWGVVLWLFLVLNQLIMYLPLAQVFGTQPEVVMTHVFTVGVYVGLRLAEKGWQLIHGGRSQTAGSQPAESSVMDATDYRSAATVGARHAAPLPYLNPL
jgi:Family of unknown function (DUF6163)